MDKLEKHIREKLQEREVQPSKGTWDKIESQLGEVVEPARKNVYWYAIAASFIGVLLISIVYFNSDIENAVTKQVVDTLEKEPSKLEVENSLEEKTERNKVLIVQETPDIDIPLKEELKSTLNIEESAQKNLVLNDSKETKILDYKKAAINEQELIENKLNQVLNVVASLEERNIEVTDAEIDSLLMNAQRELLTDKVLRENGKVDAMALLTEAEDELERTFRGQLFEKLKDGFFKVRTAVADRNN